MVYRPRLKEKQADAIRNTPLQKAPNTKTGGLGQALLLENGAIQVRYAEAIRS